MKNFLLLVIFVFVSNITLNAQINVWNGFVPLRTMRTDIEKKIGKPLEQNRKGLVAYYETPDAKILIVYASDSCSFDSYGSFNYNEWDAPYNAAMRISIVPRVKPDFAGYKFDEANYSKYEDKDDGTFTYSSKAGGFKFLVDKSKTKILAFYYFPGDEDRKFRCPQ